MAKVRHSKEEREYAVFDGAFTVYFSDPIKAVLHFSDLVRSHSERADLIELQKAVGDDNGTYIILLNGKGACYFA